MRTLQKVFLLVLFCGVMALVTGCGKHEGVTSPDEVAWLCFVGNTKGAAVSIDGGTPIAFSTKTEKDDRLYQTTPGRHVIQVLRGARPVVTRTILLGKQQTKEIRVP